MFSTIKSAWHNADIRKKILFTILMIFLFRVGSSIPVPFINTDALSEYFASMNGTIFGVMNVMSGGAFAMATFFALGVQPYINASIIIQLLTVAIPALERIAKEEGEAGKKKMENITRYTAVGLGFVQALGYYAILSRNGLLAESAVGVWWKAAIIIAAFAAGSVVIMFMGKAIDKGGIGNGISLILFAGIIARLPNDLVQTYNYINVGILKWWAATLVYLGAVAIILMIVFVYDAERRIPIQYARRVVGNKAYGGNNTFLPIKVNMSGVMPIIFAQSVASIPATIAAFIGKSDSAWANTDNLWYILAYTLLIIFFAYFYASIQFNTVEIANNLKNNGGVIPGYRPGKPTGQLLQTILNKITLFGAIYLAIVAVLPMLCSHFFSAVSMTGLSLGGTSVIIAIGVILDTLRDVETKLITRNYSGILK